MHFIQIATAALALPILTMAAAIPEKRQTGNCSGFRYLAVGAISITNTDSRAGTVIVQIRPEGSSKEADWQTVATIAEGTQTTPIPYLANGPGRKRLRVCKSDQCIFPAGEDKQWSMEQSGDRYNFELDVGRRDSDNAFQVQCDSRGRVEDVKSTTTRTTTFISSTTSSTPVSTTKPPTTTSSSVRITTTQAPTTSVRPSTTTTSTSSRRRN